MTHSLECPGCNAFVAYTSELLGKSIDCPRCQLTIMLPEEEEVVESAAIEMLPDEAGVVSPVAVAAPVKPKKKKKKKAKKSSFLDSMPSIAIDPTIIMTVVGVVFVALLIWGVVWAMKPKPAPELQDNLWAPFEVADRFKVLLPGKPEVKQQQALGISFKYYQVQPHRDCIFGVGVTEGNLPPERLKLLPEDLLNDSCNGAVLNLEQMGAKEKKRYSIKLGEYPGKHMDIDVPQAKGQFVFRNYLVGGRLYILMVGGTGLSAKHPDVVKMFESFELLEKGEKK